MLDRTKKKIYIDNMKTILRKILDKQGRNVPWLVRRTGLTHWRVEGAIYGFREPNSDDARRIADALELPEELIFLDWIPKENHNASEAHGKAPRIDEETKVGKR